MDFYINQTKIIISYIIVMDLSSYIDYLEKLLSLIPFNVFDYIIFAALALYIFEDVSFGMIAAGISLTSILSAFFIGLILYPFISDFIISKFAAPKGISDAIAFLLTVGVTFIVTSVSLSLLRRKFAPVRLPRGLDIAGGAIFGALSFFLIASFVVALLLSFPVSSVIKDSIRNSIAGRFLFTRTQGMENQARKVFGGAIEETINFLTITTGSDQSINLNFKTTSLNIDERSETQMLKSINTQRRQKGLSELAFEEALSQVARSHAKDMLKRGYFSHYSLEGFSPFDRLEMAGISYKYAGENLAFAPDVEIAMDGLMKSTGHRENILTPDFGKAGIGVIDAGIYGKMFVQEFTD